MWIVDVERAWGETASALGLGLWKPRAVAGPVDDFDAMVESLEPAAAAPSTSHWIAGRHHGHDVLACIVAQSHSDHHGFGTHTTYATYAMARLDPPLLVGLKFDSRRVITLGDIFSSSPVPDRGPQIKTLDPARTHQLLDPRDPDGFQPIEYARAFAGERCAVEITDNIVTVSAHDRVYELQTLTAWLDAAIFLSNRLAERRKALAFSAHPEWPAFAAEVGLTFDPQRHALTGSYRDVTIRLELATEGGAPFTHLRVFFPRPLGIGLSLRKQGALDSIVKFFGGQDIEVGDPVFDAAFVVQGGPVEAIRRLLWEPEARARLVTILGRAARLTVSDRALDVRVVGFQTAASTLRAMLDDATAAVRAMLAHSRGT